MHEMPNGHRLTRAFGWAAAETPVARTNRRIVPRSQSFMVFFVVLVLFVVNPVLYLFYSHFTNPCLKSVERCTKHDGCVTWPGFCGHLGLFGNKREEATLVWLA